MGKLEQQPPVGARRCRYCGAPFTGQRLAELERQLADIEFSYNRVWAWNNKVRVCSEHIEAIVTDGSCVLCQLERLERENELLVNVAEARSLDYRAARDRIAELERENERLDKAEQFQADQCAALTRQLAEARALLTSVPPFHVGDPEWIRRRNDWLGGDDE